MELFPFYSSFSFGECFRWEQMEKGLNSVTRIPNHHIAAPIKSVDKKSPIINNVTIIQHIAFSTKSFNQSDAVNSEKKFKLKGEGILDCSSFSNQSLDDQCDGHTCIYHSNPSSVPTWSFMRMKLLVISRSTEWAFVLSLTKHFRPSPMGKVASSVATANPKSVGLKPTLVQRPTLEVGSVERKKLVVPQLSTQTKEPASIFPKKTKSRLVMCLAHVFNSKLIKTFFKTSQGQHFADQITCSSMLRQLWAQWRQRLKISRFVKTKPAIWEKGEGRVVGMNSTRVVMAAATK